MKKNKIILALLSVAAVAGNSALAETATGTMQATTSVAATCNASADNINFGVINSMNISVVPVRITSPITVTCTKGTAYSIGLNAGYSGVYTVRKLKGAKTGNTDTYNYNVYADRGHIDVLGMGQSPTVMIQGIGTGVPVVTNIYSKANIDQFITPDSYSDTLTLTITY